MDLVVASNNKHKIAEIRQIIGGFFGRVYSLSEMDIDVEIEENGSTFYENALIKAKAIHDLTGMAAIADDSGLCVTALGGSPGIYSARYYRQATAHNQSLSHDKKNTLVSLSIDNIDHTQQNNIHPTDNINHNPQNNILPTDNIDLLNNQTLLQNMAGIANRHAHFFCSIVLYTPDRIYSSEGRTEGEILLQPDGVGGFGYDPLFYSHDLHKSFAQASDSEKNSVSHRGRALRDLLVQLG